MATSTTITSSYDAGNDAKLFVQLFQSADTLAKDLITPMPGVLRATIIPKMNYSAEFSDASCGWAPSGSLSLTERKLYVADKEIKHEFCKKDFAFTHQAANQGLFSANREIPTEIKEAILVAILENSALAIDKYIWNSTTTGLFDQWEADATVQKIAGTTITKANVVDEIEKVYDAIIPELDDKDDVLIVVSRDVMKRYKSAQASMGVNTTVGDKEMDYMGQRLESIGTWPNGTIAAYRKSNVVFGFGADGDSTNIEIADDVNLDGMVRYRLQTVMGQGYASGLEIVYYRTV
ncbi:hypothetical protein ACFPVY_04045 [Flavobacterium qiangtangense]|uniref:Phage major capsid protein n=1 Tax=Flavobacterium qiangtangense TaxID=1442595 RepID=A0ABW1PL70_9FLAO